MSEQFEHDHASIEENNASPGWGLKLVIVGLTVLSVMYGLLYFHADNVSRDGPSTTVRHGRDAGN